MKTKVFVCSSSEINEIKHKEDIEAIPFIYNFSDDEMFEDINELTVEAAYNKLRLDNDSNLELLAISHERVSDYLKAAINDGYDNAFFILPNRTIVNLDIPVKIALEENKEINVAMYQSNETSLPLAYMAIYALERFEEGYSILDTWNDLTTLESSSNIFIFTPNLKTERVPNFEKVFRSGNYSIFKDGRLLKTPDAKGNNALEEMIEEFCDEISNKEVIPFILTTDKSSKYNEILYNFLRELDDQTNKEQLEKIRIYNMPMYLGLECGINSIGVGYVECKKGIILEKN